MQFQGLRQFGLETLKELPSLDLYSDAETENSLDMLNKAISEMGEVAVTEDS